MKVYTIRNRECGYWIERFASQEEAEQQLARFEREDAREGVFTEDFYEIVEEEI